jgi:lipopolysaccharide export system protein LptA
MKSLSAALLLLLCPCAHIFAQSLSGGGPASLFENSTPTSSPAASGHKKKAVPAASPQGPTIIDSQAMDYDEKTRIAVFTGDYYGVVVKDPSFTVTCDKLTAYMRKAGAAPSATPTPAPSAHGKGGAADGAAAGRENGLQRAIAEGVPDRPVVIVQVKPGANGAPPERDVGIAMKADYNADTGDVVLSGWPRVSQNVNTQIATAPSTTMIMNRDGRTMKTHGPSRTVIQEQPKPGSSPSPANASPSPSVP